MSAYRASTAPSAYMAAVYEASFNYLKKERTNKSKGSHVGNIWNNGNSEKRQVAKVKHDLTRSDVNY